MDLLFKKVADSRRTLNEKYKSSGDVDLSRIIHKEAQKYLSSKYRNLDTLAIYVSNDQGDIVELNNIIIYGNIDEANAILMETTYTTHILRLPNELINLTTYISFALTFSVKICICIYKYMYICFSFTFPCYYFVFLLVIGSSIYDMHSYDFFFAKVATIYPPVPLFFLSLLFVLFRWAITTVPTIKTDDDENDDDDFDFTIEILCVVLDNNS